MAALRRRVVGFILALRGGFGAALLFPPGAIPSNVFRRGTPLEASIDGAAGIGQQGSTPDVVDLTLDFERKSPSSVLRELSDAAEMYGIEQQDVYGGKAPWMADFETEVASTLGKEAAVFCPSGVMAQLIALKIHAGSAPTEGGQEMASSVDRTGSRSGNSFLCHPSSHILLHEEGAHEKVLGFSAGGVGAMERPASFEDLREALRPYGSSADHAEERGEHQNNPESDAPSPCCFVLELPHRELGGACTRAEDIMKMGELLKAKGMAFHCDGARLWEAEPFYGKPMPELCASFDSVYVSFYKGLGGMTGAMLIGSAPFVAEARLWLRRFGGNVYTSLPYAVSCLHAFREQSGTFQDRWQKLQRVASLIDSVATKTVGAEFSTDSTITGASNLPPRVRFEPVSPQCSMVHCYLRGPQTVLEQANDEVLRERGIKVFSRLRGVDGEGVAGMPGECYFEWNIGPANGAVDDSVFVEAWTAFLNKVEALDG